MCLIHFAICNPISIMVSFIDWNATPIDKQYRTAQIEFWFLFCLWAFTPYLVYGALKIQGKIRRRFQIWYKAMYVVVFKSLIERWNVTVLIEYHFYRTVLYWNKCFEWRKPNTRISSVRRVRQAYVTEQRVYTNRPLKRMLRNFSKSCNQNRITSFSIKKS